jgi:transmembrane sensor
MLNDNQTEILIARFYSGEASPDEAMALEDWADLSPENRLYLHGIARFFSADDQSDADERKKQIWDKIEAEGFKKNGAKKMIALRWAAMAASVVLVILISLLAGHFFKNKPRELVYSADASPVSISLQDRSEIRVLPHSFVIVNNDFGSAQRKIKLNGSANFSVLHDPSREFIVDVNHLYVKDLGTNFSITSSSTNDSVFIAVTIGEVYVYDDLGANATANAGEKWIYVRSKRNLQLLSKDVPDSGLHDQISNNALAIKKSAEKKTPNSIPMIKNTNQLQGVTNDSSGKHVMDSLPPEIRQVSSDTSKRNDESRKSERKQNQKRIRDSTQSARMVNELAGDGLIIKGEPLSFTLSDTAFILNGKRLPDAVFQHYRVKYEGKPSAGWSWHHAENMPQKK